jgi:hypothetical protein
MRDRYIVGKHDDIVLAVSLAVWWAVRSAAPSVTRSDLFKFLGKYSFINAFVAAPSERIIPHPSKGLPEWMK